MRLLFFVFSVVLPQVGLSMELMALLPLSSIQTICKMEKTKKDRINKTYAELEIIPQEKRPKDKKNIFCKLQPKTGRVGYNAGEN